jgi:hypothetical protein
MGISETRFKMSKYKFIIHHFKNYFNSLLFPIKAPNCGRNFHAKCKNKLSNTCGINQKVLSDRLNEIRFKQKEMSPKQIEDVQNKYVADQVEKNLTNENNTVKNACKMSFKDFKIIKLIGRGSFGQVS